MMIRWATFEDVERLAAIEQSCWPDEVAGTREDIQARVATYEDGQFLMEDNEQLLGAIYGQRISPRQLTGKLTYKQLTDDGKFRSSHAADGTIFQLVGVSVLPEARGRGCGRLLVDHAVRQARQLESIERIVGITRPVGYHRHDSLSIADYIQLRDEHGRLVDPVLEFHESGGAQILESVADYRPGDSATRGHGVLIEYSTISGS